MDSLTDQSEVAVLLAKCLAAGRPAAKPLGRWLGDFLQPATPHHGLRPMEAQLLEACREGTECPSAPMEPPNYEAILTAAAARCHSRFVPGDTAATKADTTVRASFLRFLILGGDNWAPVHEVGIQLRGATIDGTLDLRSCTCAGRIALENCTFTSDLKLQDATLSVLVLTGSHLAAIQANRAKITGAAWLNHITVTGPTEFFGIQITGRLECRHSRFAHGLQAPGAYIGGDLYLNNLLSQKPINLTNAEIGGTLYGDNAWLTATSNDPAPISLARARLNGDAQFPTATIIHPTPTEKNKALDGQNIDCKGSIIMGAGFHAQGEVCFNGAKIAKSLDFSDGTYRNTENYAIRAEHAQVTGIIRMETTATTPGPPVFNALGGASVLATHCGEFSANGGKFFNPPSKQNPGGERPALHCGLMKVDGAAAFGNAGHRPFRAAGCVNLYTVQIGQHIFFNGGQFMNRRGASIYADAATVAGCIFLCGNQIYDPNDGTITTMKLLSRGKAQFTGASVGIQFVCQNANLANTTETKPGSGVAQTALSLVVAKIGDALFIGESDDGGAAAVIHGSLDLTATTARVLWDKGFLNEFKKPAYGPFTNPQTAPKRHIEIDQFSYDRLPGKNACDAQERLLWLGLQPNEALVDPFNPQPFEHLVKVLRQMGHDDEADDIALAKRRRMRESLRVNYAKTITDAQRDIATLTATRQKWSASGAKKTPEYRTNEVKIAELKRTIEKARRGISLNRLEKYVLDGIIGYGYELWRGVKIFAWLTALFAVVYFGAFKLGYIVPADKDARKTYISCEAKLVPPCPGSNVLPDFTALIYSADVMVPVIGFGEKSAWVPDNDGIYYLQILETILGWIDAALLGAVITGILSKD